MQIKKVDFKNSWKKIICLIIITTITTISDRTITIIINNSQTFCNQITITIIFSTPIIITTIHKYSLITTIITKEPIIFLILTIIIIYNFKVI